MGFEKHYPPEPKETMIKAELIDHLGSDLTVVNAARVSFSKESAWDFNPAATGNVLSPADTRLIG